MSAIDPTILLDTASRKPAYLLKAEALMAEIHRGRFRPCDWLPGYRALAEQLGVSRTTALAAYGELPSGGWVASTPGKGSVVFVDHPRAFTAAGLNQ